MRSQIRARDRKQSAKDGLNRHSKIIKNKQAQCRNGRNNVVLVSAFFVPSAQAKFRPLFSLRCPRHRARQTPNRVSGGACRIIAGLMQACWNYSNRNYREAMSSYAMDDNSPPSNASFANPR